MAGAPYGNKNGAKGARWRKALEKALARAGDGDCDKGLGPIADRVVALAMSGDKDAWQEIGDRLDGKPKQSVDIDIGDRPARSLEDSELIAGILGATVSSGAVSAPPEQDEPARVH